MYSLQSVIGLEEDKGNITKDLSNEEIVGLTKSANILKESLALIEEIDQNKNPVRFLISDRVQFKSL